MKKKTGNCNSHTPRLAMNASVKKLLPEKNKNREGVTDDAPFSTAEYEMIALEDIVNNQES